MSRRSSENGPTDEKPWRRRTSLTTNSLLLASRPFAYRRVMESAQHGSDDENLTVRSGLEAFPSALERRRIEICDFVTVAQRAAPTSTASASVASAA
mmetsp:Transcript_13619/g.30030  ORF Transcript_13619/g.30030 Transcript_13619/m.30030 type:complete len:97 (-) Transcript_13619:226-516(-)